MNRTLNDKGTSTALYKRLCAFSDATDRVWTEYQHQETKFGSARNLHPMLWSIVLGEEFGEVQRAILEGDRDGYIAELIDVAAVAIAALINADEHTDWAQGKQLVPSKWAVSE
ncbi:MAG: hypothetical protein KGL35_24720 [Bradyrhizobium sp.]|nr:hypothetical protein [Bradyrhizobium sp.]